MEEKNTNTNQYKETDDKAWKEDKNSKDEKPVERPSQEDEDDDDTPTDCV